MRNSTFDQKHIWVDQKQRKTISGCPFGQLVFYMPRALEAAPACNFFILLLCGGPLRPAKFGKSRKCVPISGHVFGKTEKKENRNKISFHPPRHVIYSEYQEKKEEAGIE